MSEIFIRWAGAAYCGHHHQLLLLLPPSTIMERHRPDPDSGQDNPGYTNLILYLNIGPRERDIRIFLKGTLGKDEDFWLTYKPV